MRAINILFCETTTFIKNYLAHFLSGFRPFNWKIFYRIYQLMGLKPKNKGHANFYECCDLTKKVYLMFVYGRFEGWIMVFIHSSSTHSHSLQVDNADWQDTYYYMYLYCKLVIKLKARQRPWISFSEVWTKTTKI